MNLCECGCGGTPNKGKRYIWGHNWRGKKHTLAARMKVSRARKGKPSSRLGCHLSTETKRKLSVINKGKKHPMFGKHHSIGTRRKMSKAHKGQKHSPKSRRKMSEIRKGIQFSSEHIRNLSKSHMGYQMPQSQKDKLRKSSRRLWSDITFVSRVQKGIHIKPNRKEKRLLRLLKKISHKWLFVGDGKIRIGSKNPDFWNGHLGVVELYGDYWHQGDDPQDRINYFRKFGFQTLVIWERELSDIQTLKERILQYDNGD